MRGPLLTRRAQVLPAHRPACRLHVPARHSYFQAAAEALFLLVVWDALGLNVLISSLVFSTRVWGSGGSVDFGYGGFFFVESARGLGDFCGRESMGYRAVHRLRVEGASPACFTCGFDGTSTVSTSVQFYSSGLASWIRGAGQTLPEKEMGL
ncbi:hypothetical protein EV421DRAFT_1912279 [Armillaria borealis]|uniref:Uncharacterized protein n=1 Tax=Armillaria borealis TaxID=47425 RepID=A0AA39IWB5_9AGAR|nr:hypothetical protein EV421DRAFT_1913334 [Armillaria borealis]KAK0431040.1 hypothetical protein EV421DRAFT_1912279 [Armillaria borealis]